VQLDYKTVARGEQEGKSNNYIIAGRRLYICSWCNIRVYHFSV